MRAKCPIDNKRCYQHIARTGFPVRCRHQVHLYGEFGECPPMTKYLNEKLSLNKTNESKAKI